MFIIHKIKEGTKLTVPSFFYRKIVKSNYLDASSFGL